MILQNIIFPEPGICTEESLYFRREGADFAWANKRINFHRGGITRFDTYFNGFSIEKWDKYADIGSLYIKLKLYGDFRVTVVRKEKYLGEIFTEFLAEKEFSCADGEEVRVTFDIKKPLGIISFVLFCKSEGGIFYSGEYRTDKEPSNEVKLALDICTFRRENFIKTNIRNLYNAVTSKFPALLGKITAFVIDNANTLKKEEIEYGGFARLIYNRNLGGSGNPADKPAFFYKIRRQNAENPARRAFLPLVVGRFRGIDEGFVAFVVIAGLYGGADALAFAAVYAGFSVDNRIYKKFRILAHGNSVYGADIFARSAAGAFYVLEAFYSVLGVVHTPIME